MNLYDLPEEKIFDFMKWTSSLISPKLHLSLIVILFIVYVYMYITYICFRSDEFFWLDNYF